ncbi:MAG: EAL domain-containing protein [Candidatus Dormibacteria bacterium]
MRGARGEPGERTWMSPALGTGLLVGIVGTLLLTARLPAGRWDAELGLVIVALAVSALTWRLRWTRWVEPALALLVERLADLGIVTAALLIGSPAVAGFPLIAVAAGLAVTLTLGPLAPAAVVATVTAASLGSLALSWGAAGLLSGSTGLWHLAAAAGLVVGLIALVDGTAAAAARRGARQTARLRAVALAAHHLSLATDHEAVASAVIRACRDTYPDVTYAAVLVLDEADGVARSLPLYLSPDGVVASGITGAAGVRPGQGISGAAMATGRPQLVCNAEERAALYGTTEPDAAAQLRSLGGAEHMRSAIAAPLHTSDGALMGVLVLNSHVREDVWDRDDLPVVEGIADEVTMCLERVRLYEEQRHQASTDALTGLRNRRHFEATIATMKGDGVAVLVIDVDHLKRVNDENGHEAGDRVLQGVASAVAASARDEDLVARIGGDEFAVALPATDVSGGRSLAQRVRRTIYAMAFAHGPVRISIGVAAGADPLTVWHDADAALVQAKRQGRNRVSIDGGGDDRGQDAVATLDAVFAGTQTVCSLFQPIVRVTTGELVGVEALARLSGHETQGVEDLFRTAHATHRLRDLDWLCRRTAVLAARPLEPAVPVFVNVSVAALLDPVHQVDQMLLLLRWAGQEPASIVLEITERETVADMRRLRYVLAAYREWGFRFAVDDIGEGHSTLELLAAATPEYLKLARSLVLQSRQPGARAAAEAALAFARTSGTEVIAEGVESDEVATQVASLGIEVGQGWWLGMPAQAQELRWGRGPVGGHRPRPVTPPGLIPFPVETRRRRGAGSV